MYPAYMCQVALRMVCECAFDSVQLTSTVKRWSQQGRRFPLGLHRATEEPSHHPVGKGVRAELLAGSSDHMTEVIQSRALKTN